MQEEFIFIGDKKADEISVFNQLKSISNHCDYGIFFQKTKELQRSLRKYYSNFVAQEIIMRAYSFIDDEGTSVLSTAYEKQNIAGINIISSFILAHGIEYNSLYQQLTSPKLLMLQRKIGFIGDFAKNLVSIFNQQINSGKQEEAFRLVSCYKFVALPREMQTTTIVKKESTISTKKVSLRNKVKKSIIHISRPLSDYLLAHNAMRNYFLF